MAARQGAEIEPNGAVKQIQPINSDKKKVLLRFNITNILITHKTALLNGNARYSDISLCRLLTAEHIVYSYSEASLLGSGPPLTTITSHPPPTPAPPTSLPPLTPPVEVPCHDFHRYYLHISSTSISDAAPCSPLYNQPSSSTPQPLTPLPQPLNPSIPHSFSSTPQSFVGSLP